LRKPSPAPPVMAPDARMEAAVYASFTRAALRSNAPEALSVTPVARCRAAGVAIDARAARTHSEVETRRRCNVHPVTP